MTGEAPFSSPARPSDLLDVGCVDGALASVLAGRGARVTGLDPDTRMLRAAQARAGAASANIGLVRGEAAALPIPNDAFDRVLAVTVLCFVPEPDLPSPRCRAC